METFDNNDYISDSNSESSFSEHSMQSEEDVMSDTEPDNAVYNDIDVPIPNVKANPPSWTKNLQGFDVPAFQRTSGPSLPEDFSDTAHPAEYFKLFFTVKLIDSFVNYTNQYAQIHINNKHTSVPNYIDKDWALDGSNNVTTEEMWAYLRLGIILSINPARQLRHVFSADPYMNNSGLCEIFTLRRFSKISNFFCVSDKSMEVPRDYSMYDKLYKVRAVVEQMNRLFPLYYKGSGHQVIDESYIKMASHDSVQQYCKSKPGAKFAWKVWSRCNSETPQNPYLLQFIPYMGKKTQKLAHMGFILMLLIHSQNQSGVQTLDCTQITPIQW